MRHLDLTRKLALTLCIAAMGSVACSKADDADSDTDADDTNPSGRDTEPVPFDPPVDTDDTAAVETDETDEPVPEVCPEDLANTGGNAAVVDSTTSLPSATGGTPANGTYEMTGIVRHAAATSGATAETRTGRLRLSGSVIDLVIDRGAGDLEWRAVVTLGGGGSLTVDELTCGAFFPYEAFSASGNTLKMHDIFANELVTFTLED